MNVTLNLYAATLLFAFLQGLLYILLFVRRGIKEARVSDFWLAALIAAMCVFNLSWMLGFMDIYVLGQSLWFFPQSIGLVVGPIILYYLKTQIQSDFRFTRRDFRHFVPFLVYFCYHLLIFSLGKTIQDAWVQRVHAPLHLGDVESVLENISACVYLVWSWQLYVQYRRWLPSERSDAEQLRLDWYRYFLWAVVIGVVSGVGVFLLDKWMPLTYRDIWIQRAIIGAIIYYVCVQGYAQTQPRFIAFAPATPSVEDASEVLNDTLNEPSKPTRKWETAELDKWRTKIEQLLTAEKLYLHSELTLSELADKLQSNSALVSGVINTAFGQNFNDFVNAFRVRLFLEKVKDPKLKHLTLLALAFECGFNSKSTFNRAVKKVTGQLPSDFLKAT